MNQTIYMMYGLPASGKTTKALKMVEESGGKLKRINKDDLRAMTDAGKYSSQREKEIIRTRDLLITAYITSGYDVVVDDTNLAPKHESAISNLATTLNADFVKIAVDTDIWECLRRNELRPNSIPRKAILMMYEQYVKPKESIVYQDPTLPRAIICDVDGTVASTNGRSHYDYSLVSTDKPRVPIVAVVRALVAANNYKVLFVSGREGTDRCKTDTWKWLRLNVPVDNCALLMREAGDSRADDIIKEEIYYEYINNRFYVDYVIDDRMRVVRMWQKLGLTTLNVGPTYEF